MQKINPAYQKALSRLFEESPYPNLMKMKLVEVEYDSAIVELELDERHLQPFGIVHGGVLATAIDAATFWAGFMRLDAGDGLVNVDLKLNYLRQVKTGKLIASGRCLRAGRRISYAEASVRNQDGELLAHGTSTLMTLPGQPLKIAVDKFIPE